MLLSVFRCFTGVLLVAVFVAPTGEPIKAFALEIGPDIFGRAEAQSLRIEFATGELRDYGPGYEPICIDYLDRAAGYQSVVDATTTNTVAGWWDESTLHSLPDIGGGHTYAYGITECLTKTLVVGSGKDMDGFEQGILWWGDETYVLDTLGGDSGYAYGLSENGIFVGNCQDASAMYQGFVACITDTLSLQEPLSIYPLDSWGPGTAYPSAVNDLGLIVGTGMNPSGDTHAFLASPGVWSSGVPGDYTYQDLGTLGGTFSIGNDINNSGAAVGYSYTEDYSTRAFLWSDGQMKDLGTLGGSDSYANGINNLGQVVGKSTTAEYQEHAFLWDAGVMTDLNDYLPVGTEMVLTSAKDINDNGAIIGVGTVGEDQHGYMLLLGGSSADTPTETPTDLFTDTPTDTPTSETPSITPSFTPTDSPTSETPSVTPSFTPTEILTSTPTNTPVLPDFDQDSDVDGEDLFLLLGGFGGGDMGYDLDGDGKVDATDIFLFSLSWRQS